MTTILNQYIELIIEELRSSKLQKLPQISSLTVANKRASKSKSAGPVSQILISNMPSQWEIVRSAAMGSNATDIVFGNAKGEEVEVEVKDYGSNTQFKIEVSIAGPSELAPLLGISKKSFSATEDAITKRIVGKNKASVVSTVRSALNDVKNVYIGTTVIDTLGKQEVRHITVVPGEKNDWSRVRHSSTPESKKRMLYTVRSADITSIASQQNITNDVLAAAIRNDFVSKGDKYLFLYDGVGSIRGFTLTGADPLGLGVPLFTGGDIESYNFGTHGGGMRPAVKITVTKTSGKVFI